MQLDQNDDTHDVLSVTDYPTSAPETPAKSESNSPADTNRPLKQSPNFLSDMSKGLRETSKDLQESIKQEEIENSKIPKGQLMNHIMARLAQNENDNENLSTERIDELGMALIKNYCDLNLTAMECGTTQLRLKHLISTVPELQVYFEIAQEGIKALTDQRVIQGLKDGDPDTVKMVYNKLYSGRAKGGYNPSEIGTRGYKDPLAKKLAAETENDRKKGNVNVSFNFIQKEIRHDFSPIQIEGEIIDADELEDEE